MKNSKRRKNKIVLIGGANGTAAVARALRGENNEISIIQSPADSGGSGGVLRNVFSIMAPGDARRALLALSNLRDKKFLDFFAHRYTSGPLKGHVVGNLILAALTRTTGSFEKALEEAKKLLQVTGNIIPASLTPATLCAELTDGTVIVGETNIDVPRGPRAPIKRVWLKSRVSLNPKAKLAISRADLIIIGPGDLYTSIIPNFLVTGLAKKVQKSRAKKIYIVNPVNKKGETDDFTPDQYIEVVKSYTGSKAINSVLKPVDINRKRSGALYTPAALRRKLNPLLARKSF